MSEAVAAFHFLRPWWLLASIPAVVLAIACLRTSTSVAVWARIVEPELLQALLLPQSSGRGRWPVWLLLAGWILAVAGLAGPTWERLPEPVHRRGDALVVALDLSTSMLATDLSPSRLARARFKLTDLLAARRDAYTALIAYAGDAHVVTPLSDDTGTVAAMLPALDPDIMPVAGNDPVSALRLALELLTGAGMPAGRVLLVTDALSETQARAMAALLTGHDVSLSVLGVGTPEGAPVPLQGGGFARDESGGIAVPRLDLEGMRASAGIAGGSFRQITVDSADLAALVPDGATSSVGPRDPGSRVYDQWRDLAPWVALILLPLAALGMRRGWLLLLPLCLALPTPRAEAAEWQDLWLRKDQQGAAALAAGDPARAAGLFRDPAWKGSAQFQSGDWAGAAESFAQATGADAHYNRGNALARAGKLQDALAAYDAALAASPGMEDALANRKLVEDLLRQQQSTPDKQSSPDEPKRGEAKEPGQDDAEKPGAPPQTPPADTPRDTSSGQEPDSSEDSGNDPEGSGRPRPDEGKESRPSGSNSPGGKDPASAKQDPEKSSSAEAAEGKANEEDQAVEQWLRQVPDDPGALLRRKFEYEAARRARGDER